MATVNLEELRKFSTELNGVLSNKDKINTKLGAESLLEAFLKAGSYIQDNEPEKVNSLSDEFIEYYNTILMQSSEAGTSTNTETVKETSAEKTQKKERQDKNREHAKERAAAKKEVKEKKTSKAEEKKKAAAEKKKAAAEAKKSEKDAAAAEKKKAAAEKKRLKDAEKREKERAKKIRMSAPKIHRKTLLTKEQLVAIRDAKEKWGALPQYHYAKGTGANFGKEREETDVLGAVLSSGTHKINLILLGEGGTLEGIAESLGTKTGRVMNHIYALRRSGVSVPKDENGVYRVDVDSIPEYYHKQG